MSLRCFSKKETRSSERVIHGDRIRVSPLSVKSVKLTGEEYSIILPPNVSRWKQVVTGPTRCSYLNEEEATMTKASRISALMNAIETLMSPDGHFEGPRLVAVVAETSDHTTITEQLTHMLGGTTQVHTCPSSTESFLSPGKRMKGLRLVVLNGENLSNEQQGKALDLRDSRRLPPTVIVVNKDPGELMAEGAWSREFRMGVYRTFNWPKAAAESTQTTKRASRVSGTVPIVATPA